MRKMDLPTKVWLANEIRIWGLAVTATIGVVSFIATWTHSRWNAELSSLREDAAIAAKQESDERIAEANTRAAEANQKAEAERLERLKIEDRLADRSLNAEQTTQLVGKMKAFKGQEYKVTTFWDSREPLALANIIHRALTQAEWKYIPHGEGGSFLLGMKDGIEVFVHSDGSIAAQGAASELVAAMNEVGLRAKLKNSQGSPSDVLSINVGTKP
ncbi:MAG: hypothetical protein WAT78_13210 [Rhizobiaceae bacterium]